IYRILACLRLLVAIPDSSPTTAPSPLGRSTALLRSQRVSIRYLSAHLPWRGPGARRRSGRRRLSLTRRPVGLELPQARVVDDLRQVPRQLLRRVEPQGVLGGPEVGPPLRLPVLGGRRLELLRGRPRLLRRHDGVEHVGRGMGGPLEERVV